jgi:plasmid stability protein
MCRSLRTATLTIHDLHGTLERSLRIRAASRNRSMEEEARRIFRAAVQSRRLSRRGLGSESSSSRMRTAGRSRRSSSTSGCPLSRLRTSSMVTAADALVLLARPIPPRAAHPVLAYTGAVRHRPHWFGCADAPIDHRGAPGSRTGTLWCNRRSRQPPTPPSFALLIAPLHAAWRAATALARARQGRLPAEPVEFPQQVADG